MIQLVFFFFILIAVGSLPTTHDSNFVGARALPSTTGNGAYLQNEEFLYELSCTTSSCNWSEMTQQLSTPVYLAVMMYLPDSFTCTNWPKETNDCWEKGNLEEKREHIFQNVYSCFIKPKLLIWPMIFIRKINFSLNFQINKYSNR